MRRGKGLGSELEMNHKQLYGSSLGGTEIYIFFNLGIKRIYWAELSGVKKVNR